MTLDLLGNEHGVPRLVVLACRQCAPAHALHRFDGRPKAHLPRARNQQLGAETSFNMYPRRSSTLRQACGHSVADPASLSSGTFVELVETYDFVSRNRFVSRYAYHHGYFDGVERRVSRICRVDHVGYGRINTLSAPATSRSLKTRIHLFTVPPRGREPGSTLGLFRRVCHFQTS